MLNKWLQILLILIIIIVSDLLKSRTVTEQDPMRPSTAATPSISSTLAPL